ncbi:hypothetical protein [Natronorubrum aibiense]|uniref:Uncharacterized protein n=1 Tax=Natronorubrum aibiense TaxID=348826 RepID=A0A5P9P0F8_9EURY|nr:hypothetical protein [Natronorubrum aibiense]QFU81622.1 hypothetical protein GCU68_03120 [Natronorubrum aibiense]
MNVETRQIITEELWRSVVWAGLGLFGWAILIAEFAWLDASVFTVLGLPILTWAVLTGGLIGARLATTSTFRVQSQAGHLLAVICGLILGGVAAIGFVTQGYPALWVGAIYVTVAVVTALWSWYVVLPNVEPRTTA